MYRTVRANLFAILAIASGTHVFAEEGGSVELTIDGNTYEFPLWTSQSDWTGSEQWASVNIYARPVDEETWATLKTFTLGMQIVSGSSLNYEASLVTADGDEVTTYFALEDKTPISATVDEITVDGEFLTISGTLSMTMGTSDNFGRDIDMSAPLDAAGEFNVTLGPIE